MPPPAAETFYEKNARILGILQRKKALQSRA